jgi:hypothetical protein
MQSPRPFTFVHEPHRRSHRNGERNRQRNRVNGSAPGKGPPNPKFELLRYTDIIQIDRGDSAH